MSQSEPTYAKHDRIISELMDAIHIIRREAVKSEGSLPYIEGVCIGATSRCNAERVRDSDGYLVVAMKGGR